RFSTPDGFAAAVSSTRLRCRAWSTSMSRGGRTTTACCGHSSRSSSGAWSISATGPSSRRDMMPSLRTVAHWTLRAAISAATLAYISYTVDHGDLRATLSAVHMRDLVLPLALYLAGQALSGVKWWMIGSSVGLERPIVDYVRFYFIGMSLNVFGLSTIGGDVVPAL